MTNEKIECDLCARKFVPDTLTIFAVSEYGLYDWGSPRPEVSYMLCPECLHQMKETLYAATVKTYKKARVERFWNREDKNKTSK